MKVTPVFDTNELKDLFEDMTKEIWPCIDFKPKTYLNTYLYKPKADIETIYNGMSGKQSEVTWQQRTKTFDLDSGILYYIYFDYDNSEIGKEDWLHTYAFVHKDLNAIGKPYMNQFKNAYADCGNNIWFSYMKTETYFDWHIDGPFYRYHQVLKNDGITPSFTNLNNEVYCSVGEAFIEYAGESHMVKPNTLDRLHLVTTVNKL